MGICSAIVARTLRRVGLGFCGLGSLVFVESAPAQENSTIFAGDRNWLAISNNRLWAWGDNQPAGAIGGISSYGNDANTNLFLTYRVGGETNWRLITGMRDSNATTFAIRTDGTLWAWGSNNLGQLGDGSGLDSKVPVRVGADSNWKSISSVEGKVFGLKTDGTLWAWGENRLNSGGLGIGRGRDTKQYLPVQIGQGIPWASVTAVGSNQWFKPGGLNLVGPSTSGSLLVPDTAFLPSTNPASFDASTFSKYGGGVAIGSNGQLWSWGTTLDVITNGSPDPSATTSVGTNFSPTRFGAESSWKSVAFGPRPYALKSDGTLWQYIYTAATNLVPDPWGLGFTNVFRFRFVGEFRRIRGEIATNWLIISAYNYEKPDFASHGYHTNEVGEVDVFYFTGHVLGLKQDGTLWSWGNNSRGQLGLGTTERHILPRQVGSDTNWLEASAGPYWSMGKKTDGSIWAWGDIGGAASPYVKVPSRVGTDNDWLTAVAGSDYSLAVKTDGSVFGCGQTEASSPSLQPLFSPINTGGTNRTDSSWLELGWTNGLAAYRRKMVAIAPNGSLRIWGDAFGDYPGDSRTNLPVPIPDDLDTTRPWWDPERYEPGVLNLAGPWVSITGNSGTASEGSRSDGNTLPAGFAAAVRADGTLWAWGANTNGQLGDGTRIPKDLPIQIGEGTNWLKVEAGGRHVLALQKDGSVWAWGANDLGQHGARVTNLVATLYNSNEISSVTNISYDIRFVPVRVTTTVRTNWEVTPYTLSTVGLDTNAVQPRNILPATWGAREISAGGANSLILKSDGSLWQMGNGATSTAAVTVSSNLFPKVVRVITNINFAPVRIQTKTYFQSVILNLASNNRIGNVSTNGATWRSMSAGDRHSLAVRSDGTLWSWGENESAQLGNGGLTAQEKPAKVGAGNRWAKVFAGKEHSLAIKDDGSLWAWGLNDGRLGLSFATAQTFYEPTPVEFGPVGLATVTFENGLAGAARISGQGLAAFLPKSNQAIFSAQIVEGILGPVRKQWEGEAKYLFNGRRLVFSNAYLGFLITNSSGSSPTTVVATNPNVLPERAFVRLTWANLERNHANPNLYEGEAKFIREEPNPELRANLGDGFERLIPKNGATCRVSFLFDQDGDQDGIPDLADAIHRGTPPVITSTNRLTISVGSLTNRLPHQVTATSATNSGSLTILANEDFSALPPGLFYTTNGFDGSPLDDAVGRWEIVVGAKNDAGESYQTVFLHILPPPPLITSAGNISWRQGSSAFAYQITSAHAGYSNYPVRYAAAYLPAGLSVNPTNGWVRPIKSGQTNLPAPGLYRWGLIASNAAGAHTNTLEVSVEPPGTGEWVAGAPLVFAVNLAPGASYSVSGLPPGLTFNTSTRQITGIPLAAGTNEVTIVNRTRTVTNTNRVTLAIRLGRPEIIGSKTLSFTGPLSLKRNEFFRYQISARSAGQPWAGASEFSAPLAPSWTNATGFRANLSAASGTLRYVWTNSSAASASLDWSQPLPLDSAWQASVEAVFSTNSLAGFLQNQQSLAAMLVALRDRSSNSAASNFVSVYLEGSTNFPAGEVVAEGVVDGVTNGSVSEAALGGRSALSFVYRPADGTMVARSDGGKTNVVWSEFQTNVLATWTNAARSNSLVLRLMGQSEASTNRAAPFALFRRFVVSPLGDLSYSSSNLPAGLTLDPLTGLISGTPTVATNSQSSTVLISNGQGTIHLNFLFRVQ